MSVKPGHLSSLFSFPPHLTCTSTCFSPLYIYSRQMFWWPSATHSPHGFMSQPGYFVIYNYNHSFLTYTDHSEHTCLASRDCFWTLALWFSDSSCLPPSISPSCMTFQWWALAVSILGGAMPPCEGDNDCYHECGEAEADGGHILRSDANEGRDGRWEEQHALTAQMQVQREGMVVKYNCQYVVF